MHLKANFITRRLARFFNSRADKVMRRPPDFIIGGEDSPYMKRWYVLPRNRWGNIYFHEYHRPDDDRALHDHPWHSVSLCLKGPLLDVTEKQTLEVWPGDVVFRGTNAKSPHRIDLPIISEAGHHLTHQRTLFIMGPRVREWGFHCPKGWVHWKDFTKHTETGDSSKVGRGCD
jgi:hypothetical protein